jgi:hypothetical protein
VSIPYEALNVVWVVLIVVLGVGWLAAPRLEDRLPAHLLGGPDPAGRIRFIRWSCVAVLLVVAVSMVGWGVAGAPLAFDHQPLAIGDSWGGDDPQLLAVKELGTGQSQYTYAYRPGGQIRTGFSLANQGSATLTVTGIDPPDDPAYVRSFELVLPPGPPGPDLVPVYPGEGPIWTSEPFHPFDIPPYSEVGLGLAVNLADCPGLMAIPTLAPGTSIPSEIDQAYTAGFTAASQIRIHYAAVGVSRTVALILHGALNVATGTSVDCPTPTPSSP